MSEWKRGLVFQPSRLLSLESSPRRFCKDASDERDAIESLELEEDGSADGGGVPGQTDSDDGLQVNIVLCVCLVATQKPSSSPLLLLPQPLHLFQTRIDRKMVAALKDEDRAGLVNTLKVSFHLLSENSLYVLCVGRSVDLSFQLEICCNW